MYFTPGCALSVAVSTDLFAKLFLLILAFLEKASCMKAFRRFFCFGHLGSNNSILLYHTDRQTDRMDWTHCCVYLYMHLLKKLETIKRKSPHGASCTFSMLSRGYVPKAARVRGVIPQDTALHATANHPAWSVVVSGWACK